MSDKIKIELKDLMVLASYQTLKDFDITKVDLPDKFQTDDLSTSLDSTIDALTTQFGYQFKERLKLLAYEKLFDSINN